MSKRLPGNQGSSKELIITQCVKVAGDYVEWEHGGNRTVQIAEGTCKVAFDWGDEGSLRVESFNGSAPSNNGATEAAPMQEPSHEVYIPSEQCL